VVFGEGNTAGPSFMLAWLRLVNLDKAQSQEVVVEMIADDGPMQQGRMKTVTFTVPPWGQTGVDTTSGKLVTSPRTISVHDEIWAGANSNFTTVISFERMGVASLIGRPANELWNPNALQVIPPGGVFCAGG
jgi:hypothetical protein